MKMFILSAVFLSVLLNVFPEKTDKTYFEKGVSFYAKKEYAKALDIFQDVRKAGYDNFELNYNIGSCYYKMEKPGMARFYFEKALMYRPFDKNLMNSLKILYGKLLSDPVLGEQEIMNKRMIFFIPMGIVISLILLFLMSMIVSVYIFIKKTELRKLFLLFVIISASFMIIFTIVFMIQFSDVSKKIYVVTASSSNIYLLPDENETVLYTLTEGNKGDIIIFNNDYVKIRLSDGTDGWIKKSDIISN